MKSQEWIERLTTDLKPIRPALSPRIGTAVGTLASLGFVVFCVTAFLGANHSVTFGLVVTLSVLLALVTSATYLAYGLATPGYVAGSRTQWLPDVFLILFNVTLAAHLLPVVSTMEEGFSLGGMRCSATLIALSAIPALAFFLFCRRLAPVDPRRVSRAIGVAVAAAGAFGLALHCPSDHGSHLLVYHAAPLFALEWALTYAGLYLLRW